MPDRVTKIAIVVGIPGVGKTTVLKNLIEKAGKEGIKIKVVNFGDYMFKEASEKGLIKHRDELRKLPLHVQIRLQENAAKKIREDAERGKHDVFIVDTHSLVHTVTGFWPGLPLHVITNIRPHVVFVIEALPEEVFKRRRKDLGIRFREEEKSIEEIKEFMTMARNAALSSAVLTGSAVKIVLNREGKVKEAVDEILKCLKNI
ncbi:MAG: adenylate kinase [Thermoprotei archaeon]|nr:MAG: adenylate kinase [Thermoprotei archaeon]